jgi:U32 family peptidase
VVLPRELSVDEIKTMAAECPQGLSLEVFVHGALCYGVSGRCYWSSFLGGKSGLRGRCVQPCRRIYEQKGEGRRFFSCNDLWTDVLTKVLVNIPQIAGMKIEGRKKGPHYVYYTVSAYRLFRDHSDDPKMKKTALAFLEYSLGRKGTHYNFLPQRPQNPIDVSVQTGSGMMVGRVSGPVSSPFLNPHMELLPHDLLRIGYEDDDFHATLPVHKYVSKNTKFILKLSGKARPQTGAPVFLIDRRDKELDQQMNRLVKELQQPPAKNAAGSQFKIRLNQKASAKFSSMDVMVNRNVRFVNPRSGKEMGLWISDDEHNTSSFNNNRLWFWLPPVIWPANEGRWKSIINRALAKRCTQFVLNAPWQTALFPKSNRLNLWAGPFCNIANPLAVEALMVMGFSGVIISPEMGEKECAALPSLSPLPLGIIISGNWPLCVSRTLSETIQTGSFFSSPKGEQAWAIRHGADVWVFPNWAIDLSAKKEMLQRVGYKMFIHLEEPQPKQTHLKKRPGLWNWDVGLQ